MKAPGNPLGQCMSSSQDQMHSMVACIMKNILTKYVEENVLLIIIHFNFKGDEE